MDTQTKRKSFDALVRSSHLVLVDFFTEWCGPCKMMKPVLEEVKVEVGDAVSIVKIDVEKNISIAGRYQVTGVPTFILFRDGTPVWRQSGFIAPEALRRIIEGHR